MLRNYFLIALRNLSRDKFYVFLNVIGLAIGIASLMVVATYINFERSYDSFHDHKDRIYRVTEKMIDNGMLVNSAMNHAPMAPIIRENLPGVKHVVRVFPYSSFFNAFLSSSPELKFKESNVCFGDSTFFRTFSFSPIIGDLDHALDAPYSIVLTQDMANKYFGSPEAAMGEEMLFQSEDEQLSFNVTAIIDNIPENSHFSFDFMASFNTMDLFMSWYNNWHFPAMYIYLQTEQPVDPAGLESILAPIALNNQPGYVKDEERSYTIQPIEDIHLYSHLENEWEANSNPAYLRIFAITGIFILIVACINFTNIATARSSKRVREVGVRKVMGGVKTQLIKQFLAESLIYCGLAFLAGIALAELSLQLFFSQIAGKSLSLSEFLAPQYLLMGIGLVIIVCLLSGMYPAFYLSGFIPVNALKGKIDSYGKSSYVRKGLVTFQFFVSCFLITATLIVLEQVDFMRSKDLGFSKDFIISLRLSDRDAQKNYQNLKDALLSESSVADAALSSTLPGGEYVGMDFLPEGRDQDTQISLKSWGGDEDLLSAYDLNLVKGRTFSKDIPTDQTQAFILNKSAASRLGWEDPLGKELQMTLYTDGREIRKGQVIGMVEDFHFESLHHKIEPLVIYINKHPYYSEYLSVKFTNMDYMAAVNILEKHWNSMYSDVPIELKFMDSEIENLYVSEMKISRIFNVLTLLSVFIAMIGLFGLSAFLAEKRTKEIGIRKVLGAGIQDIIKLQVKEFLILVILANILVWPVAWLWGSDWLKEFAYHMDLNPIIFGVTLISSLFMVVITLAYHAIRSTRTNPVNALRDE